MEKQQLKKVIEAAENYSDQFDKNTYERRHSFIEGAKWAYAELNAIDLNDIETLPNDFESVLCFTTDNNYQVLQMLRYGEDVENWEWETYGLKPNKAFPIDFVTHWQDLPSDPINE